MSWIDRGRILATLIAAVIALASGEVCLSKGMKQVGDGPRGSQVVRALGNRWVWAGGGLLGLHLGFYMAALAMADLGLVLTLTAAAYPLTVFLSGRVLGEHVGPARWIGSALITVGVIVVGLGEASGPREPAVPDPTRSPPASPG